MATYTVNHNLLITTGVGIQWAKDIHDGLISVGLTQTSDTGQMSMTSLPVGVATVNYTYGYNVYQFTDSYQSTFPIYIKITWASAAQANRGLVNIQVGTGTNGSGTLTGKISSSFTGSGAGAVTPVGTVNSYISFSNGCLNIAVTPYQTTSGSTYDGQWRAIYSISRVRDVNGTVVSGYWLDATPQGASTVTDNIYTDVKSTMGAYIHSSAPYLWWTESPSMQTGADLPHFPPTVLDPYVKTTLAYTNITSGTGQDTNITIPRFGTNHTFKTLYGSIAKPTNQSNLGIAILWE